jgi:hypothetical protein
MQLFSGYGRHMALFHLPSFDQPKNTWWANWPQGHKPKAVF